MPRLNITVNLFSYLLSLNIILSFSNDSILPLLIMFLTFLNNGNSSLLTVAHLNAVGSLDSSIRIKKLTFSNDKNKSSTLFALSLQIQKNKR